MSDSNRPKLTLSGRTPSAPPAAPRSKPRERAQTINPKSNRHAAADAELRAAFAEIDRTP